jgi:hypothetical protein
MAASAGFGHSRCTLSLPTYVDHILEPASALSLVLQTIGEAGRSHKSAFGGPWNRVLVLMESARVFT